MFRILFVCMGNICRSPTAEAVFRYALAQNGLADRVEADSAGTEAYHVGEPPDSRARQAAQKRGYDMSRIRARQITTQDFARFDLVLAMDKLVFAELRRHCPPESVDRLKPYMTYASRHAEEEVPDPYYGGAQGFEHVLDLVEDVTAGLIDVAKTRLDR